MKKLARRIICLFAPLSFPRSTKIIGFGEIPEKPSPKSGSLPGPIVTPPKIIILPCMFVTSPALNILVIPLDVTVYVSLSFFVIVALLSKYNIDPGSI